MSTEEKCIGLNVLHVSSEKTNSFAATERSFTVKMFTFQFFTLFSSLFYVAFFLGRYTSDCVCIYIFVYIYTHTRFVLQDKWTSRKLHADCWLEAGGGEDTIDSELARIFSMLMLMSGSAVSP